MKDKSPTNRDNERTVKPMKLVYISHIYRGIRSNLDTCESIIAELSQRYDAIFLAPWIHCCRYIEDSPENRARGFDLDCACVARCDEFWMIGEQSKGMLIEREAASNAGVKTRAITLDQLRELFEGNAPALDRALREALQT